MSEKKAAAPNRRRAERKVVVRPVQIETEASGDAEPIGVTRDVSAVGTLMFTRSKYAVGDRVQVSIYPKGRQKPEVASGKVVRVQKLEPGFPWRFATAVHFDRELKATLLFESAAS